MVRNRVHLLELHHVNIAESACLALRLGDLSSGSIDTTKHLLGVSILLFLSLSFQLHLRLDPRCFFAYCIHHLLRLIAQRRFSTEIELECSRAELAFCRTGS
jgi:hypothetical protein